ncbi:MAG: hypothetical protein RR809_09165 [Lachnospiraceae bacterium]
MLLNFIAYLLIPAYTIWFVQDGDWFTTNFSVIGNMIGRHEEFVLWGLIVGIFFFYSLRSIVKHMPCKTPGVWLIPLAVLLLTCAITTPYLPDQFPFKSFLHVIFAFVAAVCLMLCLYLILWQLYRLAPASYRFYLLAMVGITIISAVLLVIAGIVSSALEIFFTISSVILVRRLDRRIALPLI